MELENNLICNVQGESRIPQYLQKYAMGNYIRCVVHVYLFMYLDCIESGYYSPAFVLTWNLFIFMKI